MEFELINNRCNLIQYTWVLMQHHSNLSDWHRSFKPEARFVTFSDHTVFETKRARVSDPLGLLYVIAVE